MAEKKRIPEIRFDGFEEEWGEKRLGEMATFSKGNGYSKDDLTDKGSEIMLYGTMYTDYKTEIYSTNQFVDEKNNSIKSEGTEVVIPSSGETAIDIARASSIKSKEIILGGDLNIVYPDENLDNTFLALSLTYGKRKKELIKRAQGASIIHIKNDDIKQSKIIYPNISEQNKISNLISNIDNIIENISKEIKKVQDYKQSMLQKMFPKQGEKVPEIRFEGFEGEWEEKNLKEILVERDKKRVPNKLFPLVSFTSESGVIPKTERYDREFLVREENKLYKETYLNDIVYNPANLKFGAINRNKFGNAVFSPIYITFEICNGNNPIFIENLVTNKNFINKALQFQEGTVYERMSVKPKDLLLMKVYIPTVEEQNKLSSFITNLDTKISIQQQKLDTYNKLKKTLLEKIFI